MANVLTTNPIYLDTFTSDVAISTNPVFIKDIILYAGGANTKLVLTDSSTTITYAILAQSGAGDTDSLSTYYPIPCKDLTVDVSQGNFPANTIVLIYV
jgi:hypothetical protein